MSPLPAGGAGSPSRPEFRCSERVSVLSLPLFRVFLTLAALLSLASSLARAAEVIPPAPQNHFNDYARLVRPDTAQQLNAQLAQFERDTSSQLLVAIFPQMQSDSSLEDYTVRIFEAWHPGTKRQSNGAILFVFAAERRLRIATGYGLEGALPDALSKQIIENEIAPHLRRGDFDAGLTAGVHAMIAAARGEYRGSGRTQRDAQTNPSGGGSGFLILIVAFILLVLLSRRTHRREVYGRHGRRTIWAGNPWGGGWGGGGWSGGGGSSWGGGGGTFSGGGGSTGGGGASGSW